MTTKATLFIVFIQSFAVIAFSLFAAWLCPEHPDMFRNCLICGFFGCWIQTRLEILQYWK